MAATILKQGSKGKLVAQLQKFLNLKGKLPKPILENGEFGPETKEAVRFFQKSAKLTVEVNGTVGSETAGALAKLVGPAAASFAKAFGDTEDAELKGKTNAKEEDKKGASDPNSPSAGKPTGSIPGGIAAKSGNTLYKLGGYWLSVPPNPAGTFPLLMLFGGKGHASNSLIKDTPASYFTKAVLVFSVSLGKFADAQSRFKAVLAQSQTQIGTISLCGWSLGGQGAFLNYCCATKKVGLMDPTVYYKNLALLDTKAVLSINPNPGAWPWPARHPKDKKYTIGHARIEAVKVVADRGGFSETTTTNHSAYPKYFLGCHESKLI